MKHCNRRLQWLLASRVLQIAINLVQFLMMYDWAITKLVISYLKYSNSRFACRFSDSVQILQNQWFLIDYIPNSIPFGNQIKLRPPWNRLRIERIGRIVVKFLEKPHLEINLIELSIQCLRFHIYSEAVCFLKIHRTLLIFLNTQKIVTNSI